jgi:hypothetical protein
MMQILLGISLTPLQFFQNICNIFRLSYCAFKLHSDFSESSVTRGLSPLPLYVLDDKQLKLVLSIKILITKL